MTTSDKKLWGQVDSYFGDLLAPVDEVLETALAANHIAGLPPIGVTALQGKFLDFLVRVWCAAGAGDWHAGRLQLHLAGAGAACGRQTHHA
jgi:hypothetical protein